MIDVLGVTPSAGVGPLPMMTSGEIAFLARHLRPTDRVWEFGSGGSTLWLANRVKSVTSVEHDRGYASDLLATMDLIETRGDISLLYVPPSSSYTEGTLDDGDYGSFRGYVSTYNGRNIDVVLFDGRARKSCAWWVAECAEFGPTPEMRFFLHDVDREDYAPIYTDEPGRPARFKMVERVDNLALLAAVLS